MYKRILVPLDGSKLAECALPHAEELAKGCNAEEVLLLSVTEQVRGQAQVLKGDDPYPGYDPSIHSGVPSITVSFGNKDVGKKDIQAQRYLDRVAKGLKAKGIKVRTEVLFWPPAEAITAYAERNDVDIIVMSSHGRSGPSRWAHSSVTDKVLRISPVPVLMVRAPGCIPTLPG
jgi:nucleotide-binding universal stress UspA family protein